MHIGAIDPAIIEAALARDQPVTNTSTDEPHDVLRRHVAGTSAADGLRLTEQHATLISRGYLDGQHLSVVAADFGTSVPTAPKRGSQAAAIVAVPLGRPRLVALRVAVQVYTHGAQPH